MGRKRVSESGCVIGFIKWSSSSHLSDVSMNSTNSTNLCCEKEKKKKKTHNSVLSACEHANVSYFDPETAVVLVLLYNSYYL